MKRPLVVDSTLVALVLIALGAWWWSRSRESGPGPRGASLSSFDVPDHLDEPGFARRLASLGFVAVTGADFASLLPSQYHAAGAAPGHPTPDFKSMPAYRHSSNSDVITRLIGYDAHHRRVHYFCAQSIPAGTWHAEEHDTMEEELRK